jgi:hypothetical protein
VNGITSELVKYFNEKYDGAGGKIEFVTPAYDVKNIEELLLELDIHYERKMQAQTYMASKGYSVDKYMEEHAMGLKKAPKDFPIVGTPVSMVWWGKFLPGNAAATFDFFNIKVNKKLIDWHQNESKIKELEDVINAIVDAADPKSTKLKEAFTGTVFITFAESDDCVNILKKQSKLMSNF